MAEAWTSTDSSDGVKVHVRGTTFSYEEVSAAEVKRLARTSGIRKFNVKDENDDPVDASDFPITGGDLYIEEYNEAK